MPGVAQVALQMGKHVAKQIINDINGLERNDFIYKDLGIKVNVVAVGTGAAIRNSMNCDGDLLIVHSPKQEQMFMEKGFSDKKYYTKIQLCYCHFKIRDVGIIIR